MRIYCFDLWKRLRLESVDQVTSSRSGTKDRLVWKGHTRPKGAAMDRSRGVALIVGLSRMGNTAGRQADETEDEYKNEDRGQ